MRIKRLELQGFKSFKDKTIIHFDHGITGIVGPNGCGKSNIVDAFFWVMGEQSYKHMRGSGSDDLIFNGSSKYTPLGMAEATLVLEAEMVDTENAPAGASAADMPQPTKKKEVSVTRRVYRGGEGEYFVNGVPARLKDIKELFMDTGVGAKGYSVIEQGQIDKVVNSKPEERRQLIEEAAGIAKYKARKTESLRKLEAAQGNLARLNDVVTEIERNLASLERQAQKARKYKEYKDELFGKEITWGRRKAQVLQVQIESNLSRRSVLEQELVGLRSEISTNEASIETDRILQLTDQKTVEELQASIQEFTTELTTERSALELSRQRQQDLRARLYALEEEQKQLTAQIEADREALEQKKVSLESLQAEITQSSEISREREQALRTLRTEAEKARQELDALKRELMHGISQASDLTSRSAALSARAESCNQQLERLREEFSSLENQVQIARSEAIQGRDLAEQAAQKKSGLKLESTEASSRVQAMEQSLKQSERSALDAQKNSTQLRSRLQSLEELALAHEGLADGPKAVLDWSSSTGTQVFRAVADLFDVAKGYESALEGWLESRLQELVSSDPDRALEALNYLRSEKKGRAVIHLVANDSRWEATETSISDISALLGSSGLEVVGPLSEFVKTSEDLPKSTRAWMRFVVVVRSLENGASLVRSGALNQLAGWSLVSLDGTVLTSDGVLRGGSTESDSTASLLGRKRAISELKVRVSEAEAETQRLESEREKLKGELSLAQASLQELRAKAQQAELEAMAAERDCKASERALGELENRLTHLGHEKESRLVEVTRIGEERVAIDQELSVFISRRSEVESLIQGLELAFQAKDQEVRERDAELQTLKIEEASLRERAQGIQRDLNSTRAFAADREKRLDEVTRLLDRVAQEKDQHSGGDHAVEKKIEELVVAISETQAQLAEVRDRLEQCSGRINGNLARMKEVHHRVDSEAGKCNQLAIDAERLSGELSHLKQNLEEKYGVGCFDQPIASPIQEEMSEPVITQEMTEEEERNLAEELETLRDRIRRLGEVNPMAVEEYEELHKRFEHLTTERTDLEKSIQNLQDAIEHINKTSEDRFRKAFEAIAERFEKLFPIVFGGGQARLSLVYPEGSTDILDAGVDILAQPPGKKIVNIGLLSGGEKALTAISLVFAIFMVKPSPFCVLDEVDAPLDDSNIGKFNALLREMAARSQFIVITHNKKTMELNDALFGVTMEEPGVSKMVSIELR